MNPAQSVCLGIDGGATHSLGVVVGNDGRALASAEAGSLNFFGSSLAEARRSLEGLLRALKESLPAGAEGTEVVRTVVGCAALFTEATAEEKQLLCAGLLPPESTRVVSDSMTAHFGATLGGPGVVVVAGTGSIVLAKGEDGRFAQIGGWGHLLGDEGGAYWIARESLRAAIAASENRGPPTALVEAVCEWFAVKTLQSVVPILHDPATTKEKAAALAMFLSKKMPPEDAVFADILTRAGGELALQVLAAVRSSGLKSRPVPLYLVGSVVTKNALVRESLITRLKQTVPLRLEAPQLPPVLGAAAMALSDGGAPLTVEVVANLCSTAPSRP